jgi:hypothetical protein
VVPKRRVAALGSAGARLLRAYSTQVEVVRRLRHCGGQFVRKIDLISAGNDRLGQWSSRHRPPWRHAGNPLNIGKAKKRVIDRRKPTSTSASPPSTNDGADKDTYHGSNHINDKISETRMSSRNSHARSPGMSKGELIIQLIKVALGVAIGVYFVWWSLEVLQRLPVR